MTIHSGHPFPTEDDPVRRFRGRLGGQVSLWTAGAASTGSPDVTGSAEAAGSPVGLTVSSVLVARGDPARVLGLIDPDSDLAGALAVGAAFVVQLLAWRHRMVAEAFAGVAPAPGGPFRTAAFEDGPWGPHLADAATWLGARVESVVPVGWSALVTATVEHVELGPDEGNDAALLHRRGRYGRGDGS